MPDRAACNDLSGRRIGMLRAERLLPDRQRALVERPRPRKVALVLKQEGEIVEALRRIGMLGAERLLADCQRALEERPRPGKVALVRKQAGEVVEARRRIGMLGAERLLADRQRALEERPRLRIDGAAMKYRLPYSEGRRIPRSQRRQLSVSQPRDMWRELRAERP